MEHIVQISVNVDDNRIIQICEEAAAKQIIEDVKEYAHGRTYYSKALNEKPENLKPLFVEEIRKVVDENKDEIIKLAVKELAYNMARTKAVKEAVGDMLNEVSNNE